VYHLTCFVVCNLQAHQAMPIWGGRYPKEMRNSTGCT